SCGPTVYDYLHIGNARTYLVFDAFVRWLRSRGIKVSYLQNITDIDDKIIARAKEEEVSPKAIADKFSKIYFENMEALGIKSVDEYAPATKFIKEIVLQVKTLIDKGFAYKIEGDGYYFDISRFSDYGKLARRTIEAAEDALTRIDESVRKRNKGDFCLWKLYDGDPSWDTELGKGRPGWHIEDTAISEKHFGPQYDIHGGGIDLKFPHHEAEIAQQESASGKKPFVKIWMHTGILLVDEKKMSKSLGNFISIEGFLKKHRAHVLRFLVLSHHYRSPINYSEKLAKEAGGAFSDIAEFLAILKTVTGGGKKICPDIDNMQKQFRDALEDDFNTPKALAAIFEFMHLVHQKLHEMHKSCAEEADKVIQKQLKSLGLPIPREMPKETERLAEEYAKFRSNKQFMQSDGLRKTMEGLGWRGMDMESGTAWSDSSLDDIRFAQPTDGSGGEEK
ncbi:MAG: cysteine--tRNA ligase, partial [bacterium]|nr:cysteine--tRNA ligase [bacterium]